MLKFTLDTNAVIAASNKEPLGDYVEGLVVLARAGRIDLAVTTAFAYDQANASPANADRNRQYLAQTPALVVVPGPGIYGVSTYDSDVYASAEDERLLEQVRAILARGKRGAQRHQVLDVHHLVAHQMNSRDIFVTSDRDDMARPVVRESLLTELGITVMGPKEALRRARSSP